MAGRPHLDPPTHRPHSWSMPGSSISLETEDWPRTKLELLSGRHERQEVLRHWHLPNRLDQLILVLWSTRRIGSRWVRLECSEIFAEAVVRWP